MKAPSSLPAASRWAALPQEPNRLHVFPADVVVAQEPTTLSTIVGSCVAVCLWDRQNGWGGMCHHLLPDGPAEGERATRFGNVAVERLVDEFLGLSGGPRDLVAKVFGGARMLKAFSGTNALLGERNTQVALRILEERGVPVVAKDTGGCRGRKLRFSTRDGGVSVMEL